MALGENDSLETLLGACAGGDPQALRRLYDRESPRLYGLALRILRQPSAAADAVQDTFLQIWQKAAKFDPARGNAEAWLVSIVRYRALDAVRRRSREFLSDDPGLGDSVEEFDPVAALSARRDGARLRACLETLEAPRRRAILLAFADGLSHSEIADRIATPLGTVKAWIRRGMIALKTCLDS
jgi:RNA polymerase sigma-70 factor (ECF subfamily)